MHNIYKLYGYLFARVIFRKFNNFLYNISLRGLGVLNSQSEYLRGEKAWLSSYLKNKDKPIIFDVGANIGIYSKDIMSINSNSLIYAFEPHPLTFKKLMHNALAENFKAFNVGVGNQNGTLLLYDYDTNDGSSHASLYRDVIQQLHESNAISHMVEMIMLDEFVIKHNVESIDLLKIDTEGNELNVLLGVQNLLKTKAIRAIHFEFNEMNIISKSTFKDFWDCLVDYRIYRLLPGGQLMAIERYSPIVCEIYAYQNIIALLKSNTK